MAPSTGGGAPALPPWLHQLALQQEQQQQLAATAAAAQAAFPAQSSLLAGLAAGLGGDQLGMEPSLSPFGSQQQQQQQQLEQDEGQGQLQAALAALGLGAGGLVSGLGMGPGAGFQAGMADQPGQLDGGSNASWQSTTAALGLQVSVWPGPCALQPRG